MFCCRFKWLFIYQSCLIKILLIYILTIFAYLWLQPDLLNQTNQSINRTIRNSLNGSSRNFSTATALLSIMHSLQLIDSSSKYPASVDDMPFNTSVIFVTAWSANHHRQAMRMCTSFSEYMGMTMDKKRLIIYDLGIDVDQYDEISFNCPFAKLRSFNWTKYPVYVRNFTEYRWKALVIADALIDNAIVWWIDSSAMFISSKTPINHIDYLIRAHSEYYEFRFTGRTIHSIFAATNAKMYEYLPISNERAKNLTMFEAGVMVWYNTRRVRTDILKWFVWCALDRDCMAPIGATLRCKLDDHDRYTIDAHCHRFDQSAINIIAAIANNYNTQAYFIDEYPIVACFNLD